VHCDKVSLQPFLVINNPYLILTIYHIAADPKYSAFYGYGNGDVVLEEVSCTGYEKRLVDCPAKKSTIECRHKDDAGVVCVGM